VCDSFIFLRFVAKKVTTMVSPETQSWLAPQGKNHLGKTKINHGSTGSKNGPSFLCIAHHDQ
jgi:hypothetical protein